MVTTLLSFLITSNCLSILAFNVDTRNPVIITNNFDGPRSHFGATVAFAKSQNGVGPSRTAPWVVIGAPNANSPKFRNIQNPGLLWRCSLGKTNSDSCDILEMDNHGNEMQHHHAPGEDVYNRKDGSLFGGSLSVGSDRVIACASRWANQRANNISKTSHYLMNGICYWRPKTQILENFTPELAVNHTLIPLRNKDRQGFKGRKGFDWSFGQAGFSAHVTDGMETILGAPGIHDWKGTVIQLRDGDDPRLRRNGAAEDFGTFYQAPQLVMKPELETLWTQNTTYFGYAVSSGKFLESTNPSLQYVASAPRGGLQNNLTGHVIIFTFPDSADEPLNILAKIEGPVESATYFGSILCSVDLNNDGWSDLLIGSPLLSTKGVAKILEPNIASGNSPVSDFSGQGDEGGVFIYLSERDKMVSKGFVFGNNKPWSRFGSAITSIGDINRDGFNDVAIGAPYEDSRRGAVYIYHGGPTGLTKKFVQVIHAMELNQKLRGFGFSLSSGVDLDGNGYNDLAVGAYTSAQVVILRTSPVVRIIGNLTSSIRRIPINRKDFKFDVYSCVGFESKDSISQFAMGVKLYADLNSIVTRVFLTDGSLAPTNQIYYEQQVKHGSLTCRNYSGIVKQRLTLAGHRVVLRQEVSVISRGTVPQGSAHYTILPLGFGGSVPRTEQNGTAFNSFCKNCPVTEVNVTKFDLTLDPAVLCGDADDAACIADLEVAAAFSNYSYGESFVVGSASNLQSVIELRNNGGTAIYPKLEISWLRRSLVNVPSGCGQSKVHSTFILSCPLGQTLERGQLKVLELEFDMSDLMAGEQNEMNDFVVNIDASTTSDLLKPVVVSPLILPITASAKISVLATEKTMNITTLNPYNVFTHSYLLSLDGPSTLKTTELLFDVPESLIRTQHDKLITNITHIEAKQDGEEILCNGPERLSALFTVQDPDVDGLFDYENVPTRPRRRRRETPTRSARKLVHEKTLHINCNSHQVECVQIICLVHKFVPGTRTTVDFTFRMAKDLTLALMEEYGVEKIKYKTRGKVQILNVPISVESKEASTQLELPVATNNTLVWIGSSVAAGLFLILCIGLILYCCGVFSRKKPTEEIQDEVSPEAIPLQNVEEADQTRDADTQNGKLGNE